MVKIRLCGDTEEETQAAIDLFKQIFPEMNFTKPKMGSNPKYEGNQKCFSYGEPRIKNKEPIETDFKKVAKKLGLTIETSKASKASKTSKTSKPAPKPSLPPARANKSQLVEVEPDEYEDLQYMLKSLMDAYVLGANASPKKVPQYVFEQIRIMQANIENYYAIQEFPTKDAIKKHMHCHLHYNSLIDKKLSTLTKPNKKFIDPYISFNSVIISKLKKYL